MNLIVNRNHNGYGWILKPCKTQLSMLQIPLADLKKDYTVQEAKALLDKFFKRGES